MTQCNKLDKRIIEKHVVIQYMAHKTLVTFNDHPNSGINTIQEAVFLNAFNYLYFFRNEEEYYYL